MARDPEESYSWWASLKHGGLLIAPSRLAGHIPAAAPELPSHLGDRLRRAVVRVQDDSEHLPLLLDTVLEEVVGLEGWRKGNAVGAEWSQQLLTRETLRPRRVWLGAHGAALPVFVAEKGAGRLGVGKGRRAVSQVVEWLRRADCQIALLTNGQQWRLLHAGADYKAWCEWDTGMWFQEGRPGPQVEALRLLLGPQALQPPGPEKPAPLLEAILASRRGQAELSAVLGERVRLAVEHLIRSSSQALVPLDAPGPHQVSPRDIYIAATRLVMRCVVILFAEARGLLPRDHPLYEASYSLQGLREQLDRLAGGRAAERLRHQHGAWPRLLSLFRLVYHGSPHEALPILRYGGGLFQPGDPEAADPVLRALAALESTGNAPSDAGVHRILELLTRSPVKVRQGNRSTWVEAPVDFSDLSSEYIGILYEGLLDFELRRAPENEPMVFLNLGDQPALPFMRLDRMNNQELAELLDQLKKKSQKALAEEEEVEEEEEAGEEEGEEVEVPEAAGPVPEEESDQKRLLQEMVQIWAERAVKAAGLVQYPRDDTDPRVREAFNQEVTRTARGLIRAIILPGEWFLVRWGGTRKGAGTFYTRPQLAGPTVRRTLAPLCYEVRGTNHEPRTPEEILSLKVCDPAMGSGSFLVSALRFLVDALVESLYAHERFHRNPERTLCKLADGLPLEHPSQETLPVPVDHEEFTERLRARLKRHVVEKCLYGVDLDPLAVELGRMALWVETMDPRLPFGFLDHKLRCGNSLVGCFFDRFQDYPVLAWEREGGDKNHEHFVGHFREYTAQRGKRKGEQLCSGDRWTQALKDQKAGTIKPELQSWIIALSQGELELPGAVAGAEGLHGEALKVFEELHSLPVHQTEQREELYQRKILENPAFQRLKAAFDTWCAVWFWPGDGLDLAPTPRNFLDPPEETRRLVARLAEQHRFFHWELEFPDVFTGPGGGFDAVVGNPPWETLQPDSKEFFSNVDPLYRAYGKQEAIQKQVEYFRATPEVEHGWLEYCARLKALSNWVKHAAHPFGDPTEGGAFSFSRSRTENESLHTLWREQRQQRRGYADPEHPFRHQGSGKPYTYKMFLEIAHALLRSGGRLGFLVPSGIYTDKGSTDLRTLFLFRCQWEWLFGFENREKIFDIHRSFKFCPLIVAKGGQTRAIRAAFMHRSLEDWEEAERHVLSYPRERVEQFSPHSRAILEIRSARDLKVLEKIYAHGVLLGDEGPEGWGIQYQQGDFNMTSDSKLFPPRPSWEAKGYQPDEYGHWLKGNWQPYSGPRAILERPRGLVLSRDGAQAIRVDQIEDVALPLYEGRMIGQFDFSEKGWVSGKGRGAVWREIPWEGKVVEPQYLMGLANSQSRQVGAFPKIVFMDVVSATNARTFYGTVERWAPCGHSAPTLTTKDQQVRDTLLLVTFLNSFASDSLLRARVGGLHLTLNFLEETGVPSNASYIFTDSIIRIAASLCFPHVRFAEEWTEIKDKVDCASSKPWKSLWSLTPHERLRLRCILDAIVAELYGLDLDDFAWILRDCDMPARMVSSGDTLRTLDPKGFWRVDKEKDPELRHPVLALVAFHELKRLGLDAFLALNEGEGWMLPETLCLAEYGLDRDERAREPQPVAPRLGPRFLPWQLEQGVEESWEECARHAELLARIIPPPEPEGEGPINSVDIVQGVGESVQTYLFGEPPGPRPPRRP